MWFLWKPNKVSVTYGFDMLHISKFTICRKYYFQEKNLFPEFFKRAPCDYDYVTEEIQNN